MRPDNSLRTMVLGEIESFLRAGSKESVGLLQSLLKGAEFTWPTTGTLRIRIPSGSSDFGPRYLNIKVSEER